MQRNILIGIVLVSSVFAYAQDSLSIKKTENNISDKDWSVNNIKFIKFSKSMYKPIKKNVYMETIQDQELNFNENNANELTSNWFFNVAGGASAFVGNPLGCEDLFGRLCPTFHLSFGKWFNPSFGGRIAFQGFNLKSYFIEQQQYNHLHTDFLWNVTNLFRKEKQENALWQFIPYVGSGIIHNKTTHQHPFTINYGFLNLLRLNNRLSFSLELGGLTTFGNFDGQGKKDKFNDHHFHLSAGINITLGSKGWKYPKYRINNLIIQNRNLSESNKQLERKAIENRHIMAQMSKILKIEGLLSQFQNQLAKLNLSFSGDSIYNPQLYYPKNDYSGLNSLLKRLSNNLQNQTENKFYYTSNVQTPSSKNDNLQWLAINNDTLVNSNDSLANRLLCNDQESYTKKYITDILDQNVCLGSPILFFFHIDTSTLTDSSQIANIDEIARICKKYNLLLEVTGYADNATGNALNNKILSNQRAHYIVSELKKRNISEESIKFTGKGGIDIYSPDKVNRCVKIELFLKR